LEWDPWRKRWIIFCRAPAVDNAANEAILRLIASWLSVPSGAVHQRSGRRSPSKRLVVDGLTEAEIDQRLLHHRQRQE